MDPTLIMANDLETATFGTLWVEITTFRVLILLNALIGLALFEHGWHKNRRFRKPILELNA